MRRLSSRLAQIAAVAVAVAFGVAFLVLVRGDAWMTAHFEAGLDPAQLAAWKGGGDISPEFAAKIDAFYSSPLSRALMPFALICGLACGALVATIPARRILAPLQRVALAASRLADGDLTARVETGAAGVAEIDRFVREFNTMAATVERAEVERRGSSAAIAHELRTPLTVLNGRLSGMLDGVFPLDRAGVAALLVQTELLTRIVDDLRLLTLAESQRLVMEVGPCDLAAVATDVLAAVPEGVALTTDLRRAMTRCDALRLRQALQALLTNAARYGGGAVHVATGRGAEGPWVSVSDRGPGLAPEEAARVFERFWRAEGSRGRDGGGSGLGLSVAQAIARAHGGRIDYAPRQGGGAVFTIRLPAH